MKRVEIFRTNVSKKKDAKNLCEALSSKMTDCLINFDLSDRDRILRIETAGSAINPEIVTDIIKSHNFHCELFPD